MKRKLMKRNKARLTKRFKHSAAIANTLSLAPSLVTYNSISLSKQLGQRCHQTRLARQQKMNTRQLKKLRKHLLRSGLVGSKYGSICKTKLRPARAIPIKK